MSDLENSSILQPSWLIIFTGHSREYGKTRLVHSIGLHTI